MAPKRSTLEIYMDVLDIIAKGTTQPTKIMYKANLSWPRANTILKSLETLGFIKVEKIGKRKSYSITDKGKELIKQYNLLINKLVKKVRRVHI